MEILLFITIMGLIVSLFILITGMIDNNKEDTIWGFVVFVIISVFLLLPIISYTINWGFTPYEFNEKNVGKHYEYNDKIYKIVLDTATTNSYIDFKYKLKEAK